MVTRATGAGGARARARAGGRAGGRQGVLLRPMLFIIYFHFYHFYFIHLFYVTFTAVDPGLAWARRPGATPAWPQAQGGAGGRGTRRVGCRRSGRATIGARCVGCGAGCHTGCWRRYAGAAGNRAVCAASVRAALRCCCADYQFIFVIIIILLMMMK